MAFLQATMSNGRADGIPILKSIFTFAGFCIFRLYIFIQINAFCFCILRQKFFSTHDVFFFKLGTEPLIDLVFRLRTLDDQQPVTARSLTVLGGDDINLVSILNLVIQFNDISIHSGTYHFIPDSSMYRIGKIDRCRTCREGLYISIWCKAVYTV